MGLWSRRRFLAGVAGAGGAAALAALGGWKRLAGPAGGTSAETGPALAGGLQVARRSTWALGADVSIVALHPGRQTAEDAITAALAELRLVEEVMSLYRPDSQLCRLNRDGQLADPHPHLVEALRAAGQMSQRSGGAFDATVQPLWAAYAAAQRQGRLPDDVEIESARRLVDWQGVTASPGRIRLARPGMAVTLNGIAQGYAADRVLSALRGHGVENALVNTGEAGTIGRNNGRPWTAGIQHPRQADAFVAVAELDGRCLSTSGDYATSFSPDRANNHIFDPASGRSPTAFASVTVVAPTAVEADALSTAVFVLGVERGLQLVRSSRQADALLVLKDGRTLATAGFPRVG